MTIGPMALFSEERLHLASLWKRVCSVLPGWLRECRCAACGRPFEPASSAGLEGRGHDADAALQAFGARHDLCPLCAGEVSIRRGLTCGLCGLPVSGAPVATAATSGRPDSRPEGLRCGECLAHPPPWTGFTMVNLYEGTLRALLLRAKFQRDAALLRVLGELLATALAEESLPGALPQAVIPVPLHVSRLRERGYNQCLELARPLVYRLDIPLWPMAAQRVRATPFQRALSREERQNNVRGAFATLPVVRGQHVLVLDDVLTTGTTLRQMTLALLDAGAKQVDVAVVARVPGVL